MTKPIPPDRRRAPAPARHELDGVVPPGDTLDGRGHAGATAGHGAPAAIIRLVDAMFLAAARQRVRFLSIVPSTVWFWRDGVWTVELEVPPAVYAPLFRRICVMMGRLAPGKDDGYAGSLVLEVGDSEQFRFVASVENSRSGMRAIIEQVSESEFARRGVPRLPIGQPVPGWTRLPDPYRG